MTYCYLLAERWNPLSTAQARSNAANSASGATPVAVFLVPATIATLLSCGADPVPVAPRSDQR
jgi:hypothetical protein